MSLSPQVFILIALFGPLYLLIYGRSVQMRRALRRQEQEGEAETPPFAAGKTLTYSRLLQRFTLPEQAFLSEQSKLLLWLYGIMTYASLVTLAAGLLPDSVNRYGLQQSLPERVWYSYLSSYGSAGLYLSFFVVIAAFTAIFSLVTSSSVVSRTRPVPLRILFWGRVGGMYAALLAGVATGVFASLGLLLFVYGPVWKHLFDAARIVAPNVQHLHAAVRLRGLPGVIYMTPEQSRHLILSLQSSAPRIALALVAQCSLAFSFVVAAIALPPRFFGTAALRTFILFVAVIGIQLATILSPRLTRGFFFSTQLGHPPPYAAFVAPVALSVLLLVVAQQAATRREL